MSRTLALFALTLPACAGGADDLDPTLARVVDEVVVPLGLDADSARVFAVGPVGPGAALTAASASVPQKHPHPHPRS